MQSVTFFNESPLFELLPVMKTRYFIGDFKLLMYARLAAVQQRGLIFDLMKFERDPDVTKEGGSIVALDSCVAVSLGSPESEDTVTCVLNAAGTAEFFLNGKRDFDVDSNSKEIYLYRGTDEQGWYWGARFSFPPQLIQEFSSTVGKAVLCNAFAFQNGDARQHFGAILPVCSRDIFARENLSELIIRDGRST